MKGGRYRQPWNPTACVGDGGGEGKEEGKGRGTLGENDPLQNAQSFIWQWRKMKGRHNEQYRLGPLPKCSCVSRNRGVHKLTLKAKCENYFHGGGKISP